MHLNTWYKYSDEYGEEKITACHKIQTPDFAFPIDHQYTKYYRTYKRCNQRLEVRLHWVKKKKKKKKP
jgi:hypothetical protein